MITKEDLINSILSYDPNIQIDMIAKAIDFAIIAHGADKRDSGDPYYQHPLEVANIIASMKLDRDSIITALLHDTVEDTSVTLSDIATEFNPNISKLVDGVTKLTQIEYQPDYVRQAENFRKLLLAMSDDIRVLLVKLADRVHNMRTLSFIKAPARRFRIARETMDVYAPLAERIGIHSIKEELQELAFAELYKEERLSIINRLSYLRKDVSVIDKIVEQIKHAIDDSGIENFQLYGREKSPCSIWKKMEKKNVNFEQLSDIMAFRINVASVAECYQILGIIHSTWKAIPDSFKDFISTPKDNGYKSIHTVVIGPENRRIEVQIRTHYMNEVATLGVAAHWSYKQNYELKKDGKQFRWIRELLEVLENISDPEEFIEQTKLEIYYDQVFCFTPAGELLALPRGACPVDFAYAIHSDVGNACVGARVNASIVPLRTVLQNGDQVDIICSKIKAPSPSWEKFAVTGKAKAQIRKFVNSQKRSEYEQLGRIMITKALNSENFEVKPDSFDDVLDHFKKKSSCDLFAAIGEGRITREDVLQEMLPGYKAPTSLSNRFSFLRFKTDVKPKQNHSIPIKGLIPDMAVHYAGCCHPLPGDRIVGIVHAGKGITIHVSECEMLENFSSTPERWIDVSWEKDVTQEAYIGRIKVTLSNEPGALAEVSTIIAKDRGNIINFRIASRSTDFFEMIFDIEVKGAHHLSNIIKLLRSRPSIHTVERIKA
jgi:GTP pyrophosphokinase